MFFWFSPLFQREELKHLDTWHSCPNGFAQALGFFCFPEIKWREMFTQVWPQDFGRELGPILALPCTNCLLWDVSPNPKPLESDAGTGWGVQSSAKGTPSYLPTCPKLPAGPCLRAEAWAERKGCRDKAVALLDSSGTALPSHSFRMSVFPKKSWFFYSQRQPFLCHNFKKNVDFVY